MGQLSSRKEKSASICDPLASERLTNVTSRGTGKQARVAALEECTKHFGTHVRRLQRAREHRDDLFLTGNLANILWATA